MDIGKVMAAEVRRNLIANDRPRVPPGLDLYWIWYGDLAKCRRWTMAGPDPISFGDISDYGEVFGWEIRPKDVQVLMTMDQAYLAYFREKQGQKGGQARPTGPISSAIFDAMFS